MSQPSFPPLDRPVARCWYFPFRWANPQPVELVGKHKSGALILREVGRVFPGHFLASPYNVIKL